MILPSVSGEEMFEFVQSVAFLTEYGLSAVLVGIWVLILRGFLPIFVRPDGTAVWHLAASFVVLSSAVGMRMAYWSFVAQPIRQEIGKGIPNTLFGLMLVYGMYLVLRLLWLIIPDHDRGRYSLLTAPWYPHGAEWRLDIVMSLLRRRKGE